MGITSYKGRKESILTDMSLPVIPEVNHFDILYGTPCMALYFCILLKIVSKFHPACSVLKCEILYRVCLNL